MFERAWKWGSAAVLVSGAAVGVACGSSPQGGPGGVTPVPSGGTSPGEGPGDGGAGPGSPDASGPAVLGIIRRQRACANGANLEVVVLDDGVVRLHFSAAAPETDRGWLVRTDGFGGPTELREESSIEALVLRTKELNIAIRGSECALDVTDANGNPVWQDASSYRSEGVSTRIARKLQPNERIFGLGEKGGAADRRGRAFENWTQDPAWADEGRNYTANADLPYQAHPFFLAALPGRASGAFVANHRRSRFDIGKTKSDQLAIQVDAGDLDLYVFAGPQPARVVERYTALVGRAPLPPLWALGYHQSKWSYYPESNVREIAATFRKKGLPIDGLWLDIHYMLGYRSFTWDPARFADPAKMLAELEADGFKTTTIIDPGIKSDPNAGYAAYDEGVRDGHFFKDANGVMTREVWPGQAAFPDYSRKATRAWWAALVQKHLGVGLRGTWIDMNEPAFFGSNKETYAALEKQFDAVKVDAEGTGGTFADIRNVYAYLMARATYEGALAAAPNRRPFVLTRSGFAGIQKYSSVWTGDAPTRWDVLAVSPAMLMGLSLSGVPFVGSDVGGFTGRPADDPSSEDSAELFTRWFELGAVSPFFRGHVQESSKQTHEPWAYGAETEARLKTLLEWRYRFLPHFYNAFVEASETGRPILRPLWFEHADDADAYAVDDQLYVGGSMMVAPVLRAGQTSRQVYVPAGVFYDLRNGTSYEGPRSFLIPAPLGEPIVLVRGGGIVPEQELVQWVGQKAIEAVGFDVFPGKPGTRGAAVVQQDDGESLDYQRGTVAKTSLSFTTSDTGVVVDLGARVGTFVPPTKKVTINVYGVAAAPTGATIDGAAGTVAYDAALRVARVSLPYDGAAHRIEVKFDATTLPTAPETAASRVRFVVTLPASTPANDTIYLAGDAFSTPGWKPDGLALTRSGSTATGTLSLPPGTRVTFKATRGTWATVEKNADCTELANRTAQAPPSGSSDVAVNVAKWAGSDCR
jgi:alpha-glucosidase